jgi:molybdenum cofactor cytidylyltransferase
MPSIAAIILAAGAASRMGAPKQLLKIDGETLIRRTARAAIEAQCSPVVAVLGAGSDEIAGELADLPVPIALNPHWQLGMGTSVRAGLAAALRFSPDIAGVLLTVCDQPHLSAQILANLLTVHARGQSPITASAYADTLGPPGVFSRQIFTALEALEDQSGAKKLITATLSDVTPFPWEAGAVDIDTPQDWASYRKQQG